MPRVGAPSPKDFRRCMGCGSPVPVRYMVCIVCEYDHRKSGSENRARLDSPNPHSKAKGGRLKGSSQPPQRGQ